VVPTSHMISCVDLHTYPVYNISIAPTLNTSDTVFSALASHFPTNKTSSPIDIARSALADKTTGLPKPLREKIGNLAIQYVAKEDISAVNGEATLCLKKSGVGHWGICEDLPLFFEKLVELEKERWVASGEGEPEERKRLRIDAFYGETDLLIGKSGEAFF